MRVAIGKMLLSLFWDWEEAVAVHIQPFLRQAVSYRDERITSQRFDGMDRDDLRHFVTVARV